MLLCWLALRKSMQLLHKVFLLLGERFLILLIYIENIKNIYLLKNNMI